MQQTCLQCSASFKVTDEDLAFYEKASPVIVGKKCQIPPPTFCPDCRQQRRLSYRNERTFYHRTCDKTGETMISIYPKESPYTVFNTKDWWSDTWDPLTYGQDADFTRPFFEQFAELQRKVPRPNLFTKANENSEYTNHCDHAKNCYLCADVGFGEDVFFSKYIINAKNCADCYMTSRSELCYETMYTEGYRATFTHLCEQVSDSYFLYDCKSCHHCLFCWNLRGKNYCIRNKQYTREAYEKELQSLALHTHSGFTTAKNLFSELVLQAIRQPSILVNCEQCNGGALHGCKNVTHSFDVGNARDCAYCYMCDGLTDCWDTFESAFECELQYEGYACNRGKNLIACSISYDVQNVCYCDMCHNSSNLFGCVGLRHKQYCILNKQYNKEEYEALVPKLIEHMQSTKEWGEFFPPHLSPFAYNETIAPEYFPMTKEQVEARGWRWRETEDETPKVEIIIPAASLPDSIDDIPDDIVNWAIRCEETNRPFRVIAPELAFYRAMRLPIPHLHPDVRHRNRMARRDPSRLWTRKCGKCGKEKFSTYSPERPEIVYCEECYLKEVY